MNTPALLRLPDDIQSLRKICFFLIRILSVIMGVLLLTLVGLLSVDSYMSRSYESNSVADTEWRPRGIPYDVTVTVLGPDGGALARVPVEVEDMYGGRPGRTDQSGKATFSLSPKAEMLGIKINGHQVMKRDSLFSPDLRNGLLVTVHIKSLKVIGELAAL
jgi:hypothetical protein